MSLRPYAVVSFALLATLCGRGETFLNPYRIPTSITPISVAVADVNGDGLLDIVYGDNSTNPQTVHVLLAQRSGGYAPAPVVTLPANVGSACRVFDTNKDGRPDLVCLYDLTYSVSLVTFLGNGDGTFGAPSSFALPSSTAGNNYFDASASMPMDLNGDGVPDLIVADLLNSRSYVVLGDGHGSFTLASTLSTTALPIAMDVNGDGKPDLLYPDGPLVALGNGNGTFGATKGYSQAFDEGNVCAFHDMDGDGHADAVCGYTEAPNGDIDGATHLIVLHGNADGSFNATPISSQQFGTHDTEYDGMGTFLYPVAAMDLNGDGVPDIVSYSADGYGVLLGQPGLPFTAPKHYAAGPIAAYNAINATFADMNGDGLPDIVSTGTSAIYISYGRSNGSFATASAFEAAQSLNNAAFADFNGDGTPDIVATGDTTIELGLGNGDGTFAPFTSIPNNGINFSGLYPSNGSAILSGDFNGDGKQDIFAVGALNTSTNTGTNAYTFFGRGDGTFNSPVQAPNLSAVSPQGSGTFVADVNKDGLADIVSANNPGTGNGTGLPPDIYVSLSNGDGSFRTITSPVPNEPYNGTFYAPVSGPALADFNHDGALDAAIGEIANAYVLKGHGDGTFDPTGVVLPIPVLSGCTNLGAVGIATGDFDGDGNADVAVLYNLIDSSVITSSSSVSVERSAVFIYYGNGDGTFASPIVAALSANVFSVISAADLNGDGLPDLVLRYEGSALGAVGILHAQAGRTFGPEFDYTAGNALDQLAILDVNRDGRPDLLFANNLLSGYFSNSVTALLNQAPIPVVTGTLVANPEPSPGGVSFNLTATLTPPSSGTLSGTVEFFLDGASVGIVTLTGNTASVTLPGTIPLGTHTTTAVWAGNSTYAPVSLDGIHTVGPIAAVVTVTSSLNPANAGQTVTFTAVASDPVPNSGIPTGTITFMDGSTVLATQPLTAGTSVSSAASLSTSSLSLGSHTITATYNSTGPFNNGSATLTQVIGSLTSPTTTALASSLNPANVGQSVAFTATVSGTTSSFGAPTGTISFADGTTVLAVVTLSASSSTASSAGYATSTLVAGSHSITATYVPTGAFTASSAALTESVSLLATSTTLAAAPNPAAVGQSVTLAVAVTGSSATPTGTINFYDGATLLGTSTLDATGRASFITAALTIGTHPLTAAYSSTTASYSASTSPTVTETINPLASSTNLTAAPNPATVGQTVTLTAVVTGAGTTPSGAVNFYDGATLLGTSTLDATGHTTYTTSTLTAGTHTLTAVYSGLTGTYAASTSPAVTETIQPLMQDFSIALTNPTITIETEHHLTTTLTLTSINSFADTLTITCGNLPTWITCRPTTATTPLAANATATASLYIDTDSVLGYARNDSGPLDQTSSPILALLLSPFGLFASFAALGRRRSPLRTRLRFLVLLLASLPGILALSGCGSVILPTPIPPSAAPGTYTLPITATGASTGLTHTAQMTLIVTP